LVCDGASNPEIVHADGTTAPFSIDREEVRNLYKEAFRAAEGAGFKFPTGPVELMPQPKLVEIVRKSQELALAGLGGEADEGESNAEPGA
jgi:CRISPR-associated protein Csb1